MQPNIGIEWLRMLVDPADSSYMPTLVVISGGDSLAKMRELATIRITPSDTWVTLLRNVKEVSRLICYTSSALTLKTTGAPSFSLTAIMRLVFLMVTVNVPIFLYSST